MSYSFLYNLELGKSYIHVQKDLGITRIVENKGVLGTIRDTLLSCAIGAIVLYNTLKQEISTIGTWDY